MNILLLFFAFTTISNFVVTVFPSSVYETVIVLFSVVNVATGKQL